MLRIYMRCTKLLYNVDYTTTTGKHQKNSIQVYLIGLFHKITKMNKNA